MVHEKQLERFWVKIRCISMKICALGGNLHMLLHCDIDDKRGIRHGLAP